MQGKTFPQYNGSQKQLDSQYLDSVGHATQTLPATHSRQATTNQYTNISGGMNLVNNDRQIVHQGLQGGEPSSAASRDGDPHPNAITNAQQAHTNQSITYEDYLRSQHGPMRGDPTRLSLEESLRQFGPQSVNESRQISENQYFSLSNGMMQQQQHLAHKQMAYQDESRADTHEGFEGEEDEATCEFPQSPQKAQALIEPMVLSGQHTTAQHTAQNSTRYVDTSRRSPNDPTGAAGCPEDESLQQNYGMKMYDGASSQGNPYAMTIQQQMSLESQRLYQLAPIAEYQGSPTDGNGNPTHHQQQESYMNIRSGNETGHFNSRQQLPPAGSGQSVLQQIDNNEELYEQAMPQSQAATGKKMGRSQQELPLQLPDENNPRQAYEKDRLNNSSSSIPVFTRRKKGNHYSPVRRRSEDATALPRTKSQETQKSPHSKFSQNSKYSRHSRASPNRSNNKSCRSTQQLNFKKGASQALPQAIHSGRASSQGPSESSTFAQEFQNLYTNIWKIFPGFLNEVDQVNITPTLREMDVFTAIQFYNHMNFMYKKSKDLLLKDIRDRSRSASRRQEHRRQSSEGVGGGRDRELDSLMQDQAQTANNMLKYQLENLQKETEYYKKQMDMFKEQLQIAALREHDTEQGHEQRMQNLSTQVRSYEARIEDMKQKLVSFEKDERDRQLQNNYRGDMPGDANMPGNISFRAKNKAEQKLTVDEYAFKTPEHSERPADAAAHIAAVSNLELQSQMQDKNLELMERARTISQLQQDLNDARARLKSEETQAGFERERNGNHHAKIEALSQQYLTREALVKSDCNQLKEQILQNDATINALKDQVNELARSHTLEFPLLVRDENIQSPTLHLKGAENQINLTNQRPQQPKFVSMAGKPRKNIMNDHDFEDDIADNDNLFKVQKNSQMPFNRKSSNPQRKNTNPKKQNSQLKEAAAMINLHQLLQTQISTTMITDQIIREHKDLHDDKINQLQGQLENCKELEEKMQRMESEKKELGARQVDLTKQNEDLKIKFSHLLDQFQEYVNETERKMEEEQNIQKDEQEKLLNELNGTIKELELMSQTLQNDCQDKEQKIKMLEEDKVQLNSEIEVLKDHKSHKEDHIESVQNVKIQSLNEEINYLKKHYVIEMDALRDENKQLRQRYRERSNNPPIDERGFGENNQNEPGIKALSPYQLPLENENVSHTVSNTLLGRKFGDDQPADPNMMSRSIHLDKGYKDSQWQTPCPGEKGNINDLSANQTNDLGLSRNRSALVQPERTNVSDHGRCGHYDNQDRDAHQEDEERDTAHASRPNGSYYDQYGQRGGDYRHDFGANDRSNNFNLSGLIGQANPIGVRSKSHDRAPKARYHRDTSAPNVNRSLAKNVDRSRGDSQFNQDAEQQYNPDCPRNQSREHSREMRSSAEYRSGQSHEKYQNYNRREPHFNKKLDRTKHIISSTKDAYDGMKRELQDKNRLIEQKNREIVKLRLENDEMKSSFNPTDQMTSSQQAKNKVINDMDFIAESLKIELERTKVNLFKEESTPNSFQSEARQMPLLMMNKEKHNNKQQIIQSEQKFIALLMDRVKNLRNVISLASEVFLLTNKQKYNQSSKGGNETIYGIGGSIEGDPHQQKLMEDNANLQRTIYKYEATLAQLDSILRNKGNDSKDDIIFELKKLTENQLKEIVKLQDDLGMYRKKMGSIDPQYANQEGQGDLFQENRVLKQEILMLREQAARNEQLQEGNDELVNERRSLLLKVQQLESLNQQAQSGMNDASHSVKERDTQLEELRSRITVVAELFEKKPIKQRYSFEVLCDFIHDKAKRLFGKYENAIKERKQAQEEKAFYYQKKIHNLESDHNSTKDAVALLRSQIVPKLVNLVNKQVHGPEMERLNGTFLRELVDDVEYQFKKYKNEHLGLQQANIANQERIQELQMVIERLSQMGTPWVLSASNRGQPTTMGTCNQNSEAALNTFGNANSNGAITSLTHSQSELNKVELEQMKHEKAHLNRRLDDFSDVLKEFQENQRNYMEENQHLKQKIGMLENHQQQPYTYEEQPTKAQLVEPSIIQSRHGMLKEASLTINSAGQTDGRSACDNALQLSCERSGSGQKESHGAQKGHTVVPSSSSFNTGVTVGVQQIAHHIFNDHQQHQYEQQQFVK